MKNGLVILDSGPIFSLASVNRLEMLDSLFDKAVIPKAVWQEITFHQTTESYEIIERFLEKRVVEIEGFNELSFIMDYGDSEALILYRQLKADFLLIDDKKARSIAENSKINCIGTLGILIPARRRNFIKDLRPIFKGFLENKRYYSIGLLNEVLKTFDEELLND